MKSTIWILKELKPQKTNEKKKHLRGLCPVMGKNLQLEFHLKYICIIYIKKSNKVPVRDYTTLTKALVSARSPKVKQVINLHSI